MHRRRTYVIVTSPRAFCTIDSYQNAREKAARCPRMGGRLPRSEACPCFCEPSPTGISYLGARAACVPISRHGSSQRRPPVRVLVFGALPISRDYILL